MTAEKENRTIGALRVNLLVLGASQEPVDLFMNGICTPLQRGEEHGLVVGGVRVAVSTLFGLPEDLPDWSAPVKAAGAILLPVEHVDALSMEGVRSVYDALMTLTLTSPLAFFIIRQPGGREFKVSCMKCGQKIMLRDEYVGRGCTCPNCRKSFTIVSQKMALRQQLRLPMHTQVEQVDGVNAEFTLGSIERLIERAAPVPDLKASSHQDALKHTTMRINLSDLAQPS